MCPQGSCLTICGTVSKCIAIYVGRLSGTVTEDEVRRLFSVAGPITSVHRVKDPESGQSRGCGYVRMSSEDGAEEAISLLNGAMLGDQLIVVKHAPKKKAGKTGASTKWQVSMPKGRNFRKAVTIASVETTAEVIAFITPSST